MMSAPVLTFFNNKGGVGKTSLVYHLAIMLAELEERVLVCDLDPQANLTASFLDESELEALWRDDDDGNRTIYQCLKPLKKVGDLKKPEVRSVNESLGLIPGDLNLSGFEDNLSEEWPKALDANPFRSFRVLTALWQIMQSGAAATEATMILVDVGPNLGALNRSALVATDHVIAPLGADLFSLQGLKNLGPALQKWRKEWKKRLGNWSDPEFVLPGGYMQPIGYVVQQHAVRLGRPVQAYDKWVNRIPEAYGKHLLASEEKEFPAKPEHDPNCLAMVKHYRSLVPMAQEARKPIFALTSADGAIGSHAQAVAGAHSDFRKLTRLIQEKIRSRLSGGDDKLANS